MTLTPEHLAALPVWQLDKMLLPRGGCSESERLAAQQEIKRRYGLPAGAIKLPPAEPPIDPNRKLVRLVGGGWAWEQQEMESDDG